MKPFESLADDVDQRAHVLARPTESSLRLGTSYQRALVRILMVADRRSIDSVPLVQALAAESPWRVRRPLRQVAKLLRSGVKTLDALEQIPGVIDPTAITAMRLATQTGTQLDVMRALVDEASVTDQYGQSQNREFLGRLPGLAIGFGVASFIMLFISNFILPTLEQMFDDLELQIPILVRWFHASLGYMILLLLLGVFLMIAYWFSIRSTMTIPRWRRWLRLDGNAVSGSSLLTLLAMTADSGRPLAAGVESLSKFHSDPKTRNRFRQAREQIDQGTSLWKALNHQHLLGKREIEALAATDSAATQAWLLREFATAKQRSGIFRDQITRQAISLSLLLLLGIVVACVSLSLFSMLSELIGSLA